MSAETTSLNHSFHFDAQDQGHRMPAKSQVLHHLTNVRGVLTEVLIVRSHEESRNIVFIIPGNPGLPEYYETFAKNLHSQLQGSHQVWVISHAGHTAMSHSSVIPGNGEVFGYMDQVQHKLDFINDYVPSCARIIFVGHSIGCKIILDILSRLKTKIQDTSRIEIDKSFMLFPTVERMKESPNGEKLWPVLALFRWFIILLGFFASVLPQFLKVWLVSLYFWRKDVPECCKNATLDLLRPSVIRNVLFMAYQELCIVQQLDIELINQHLCNIHWYYGFNDDWCPRSYYYDLVRSLPDIRADLCSEGIEHAFVLQSSALMAQKLANWIKN
ncbi:lipid droplet associated hydrolase sturkopf [Oratosquilla oratoria]|uniref:lipid droplet associated hydrolase sturkopf n=1 Tax=Oratosquilla oratoria TaxID=337810 RepID=UPI003F76764F